jgi:hypothetical protein
MVMSGLGPLWNIWSLMIIMFMLFIIHVYLIMWLFGAYAKLVATQLLKHDSLKAIVVNLCQTFWASWTPWYICWVRYVLTLAILTTPVRLVINQSIVPMELELSPEDRSVFFRCLLYKVIFFVLIRNIISIVFWYYPVFVAICVIWLPGLIYGVYLVLSLKPGATPLSTSLFLKTNPNED